MLSIVFQSIFDSTTGDIGAPQFLICILVALVLGFFLAYVHGYRNNASRSFLTTLAVLPAIVCVIILMVNGNVGAGVAVAGAFSLVRFRSAPGSAREIGSIFLAMGAGLVVGMGYLAYAVLFTLIVGLSMLYLTAIDFQPWKNSNPAKTLRITVPEDLNYSEVFEDLFAQYTTRCENVAVKTSNMGSLYKLTYHVTLKDAAKEKEFIDALRCRNGNLEINMMRQEENGNEL